MNELWIWTYGPLILIGILVFLPIKWDLAFWVSRMRGDFDDKYTKQAKEDQKKADYPGCRLGFMECRSMSCFCNGEKPHRDFVKKRVKLLSEGL